MRILQITLLSLCVLALTASCASSYKSIEPKTSTYNSKNTNNNIIFEYQYETLHKKYAKKGKKKGIKLVSIKITNNTDKDLVLGKDVFLSYENGSYINIMETDEAIKSLKQNTPVYLLYLLLTPINIYTTQTSSNGIPVTTSSFPVGLILGPGLAGGNMIVASSANSKFKTEMLEYNINGTTLKKGQTTYGIIGLKTDSFNPLKLKVE